MVSSTTGGDSDPIACPRAWYWQYWNPISRPRAWFAAGQSEEFPSFIAKGVIWPFLNIFSKFHLLEYFFFWNNEIADIAAALARSLTLWRRIEDEDNSCWPGQRLPSQANQEWLLIWLIKIEVKNQSVLAQKCPSAALRGTKLPAWCCVNNGNAGKCRGSIWQLLL